MINQILQDSLSINQTKCYYLTHLPLREVEDLILNCSKFENILFVIEQNETTFKVTGEVYDKLVKLVRENIDKVNWFHIATYQKLSENFKTK